MPLVVNVRITGHCIYIRESECLHVLLPSCTKSSSKICEYGAGQHRTYLCIQAGDLPKLQSGDLHLCGYQCIDVTDQKILVHADPKAGVHAITGLRHPGAQRPGLADQADYEWLAMCDHAHNPDELFTKLQNAVGCGRFWFDSAVLRAEQVAPNFRCLPCLGTGKHRRVIAIGVGCTIVAEAVTFSGICSGDVRLTASSGRAAEVLLINDPVVDRSQSKHPFAHFEWLWGQCCGGHTPAIDLCDRASCGRAKCEEPDFSPGRRLGNAHCPGFGAVSTRARQP